MSEFWRRYKKSPSAVIGLFLISIFILIVIFGPNVAPYSPSAFKSPAFNPPDSQNLMGTDDLGRDIFSRVLYGARVSLIIGFLSALLSTLVGVIVGSFSGYYGGRIDDLLTRLTEFFQVLPKFFLALIIVALFGSGIVNVVLVIAVLSWPSTARLVRAEFLYLKELEFIEAARSIGAGSLSIMFNEILPNAIHVAIVNMSMQAASSILIEAGLSFLGLSDPNVISWGYMLRNAQDFYTYAWWMAIFPGFAIFLTVLSFNLIGEGLNDALNPMLKEK